MLAAQPALASVWPVDRWGGYSAARVFPARQWGM